jgi:hypothetical protein
MATITKHIGKIKDAGTRVAIMYRTLPEEKDHALVVSTDNLPNLYHDSFIAMIDSPEGQQANELYEVANRRAFPDGKNMLSALHESGNLVKVPTSNVMVMPNSGTTIALDVLNKEIAAQTGAAKLQQTENILEMNKQEAKNLLLQAEGLEAQAKTVRENAYSLDESLRPKRGRPVGSTKKADAE